MEIKSGCKDVVNPPCIIPRISAVHISNVLKFLNMYDSIQANRASQALREDKSGALFDAKLLLWWLLYVLWSLRAARFPAALGMLDHHRVCAAGPYRTVPRIFTFWGDVVKSCDACFKKLRLEGTF